MSDNVIGFVCGSFDLLHPGHITLLQEAREQCNMLVVGLLTHDEECVQSVFERWMQLKACKMVDEIIPYESEKDLEKIFSSIPMHRFFVPYGVMNQSDDNEQYYLTRRGIELIYTTRDHNWSSRELRDRMK